MPEVAPVSRQRVIAAVARSSSDASGGTAAPAKSSKVIESIFPYGRGRQCRFPIEHHQALLVAKRRGREVPHTPHGHGSSFQRDPHVSPVEVAFGPIFGARQKENPSPP